MIAASARRRDLPIKNADLRVAATLLLAHARDASAFNTGAETSLRTALVFGPEASGLNNDEVALADILVTAPLNPAYPSLNLAQAVLLMAWEWRMATHLETQPASASSSATEHARWAASIQERDFFFRRLETALDDSGFFTALNGGFSEAEYTCIVFAGKAFCSGNQHTSALFRPKTSTKITAVFYRVKLFDNRPDPRTSNNSRERGLLQRDAIPVNKTTKTVLRPYRTTK